MKNGNLRARWILRLYREHRDLCYQHRIKLPTPLIDLTPTVSRWGAWDPLTRTLTLSQQLVENHPWSTVVAVLRHEMAHQHASQFYAENIQSETPHGPLFQTACAILAVPAGLRGAKVDLGSPLENLDQPERAELDPKLVQIHERAQNSSP